MEEYIITVSNGASFDAEQVRDCLAIILTDSAHVFEDVLGYRLSIDGVKIASSPKDSKLN